jgi:A/G-specific adenine glycosylase
MAFAFEEPYGVLDTNIGRVIARAIEGRSLTQREAQRLADALVCERSPREFNLAMMDFGATVCTSRSPHCAECPLQFAGACAWQRQGGDDPSRRSFATSRPQPRFQGSNREGRGRLLRAALLAPISAATVASVAGWPEDPARASKIAAELVASGLLVRSEDGSLSIPN